MSPRSATSRAIDDAPARDALSRAQYADLKIWLPGDILTKVDRTSMAVSLEAREPLLDHRLVEFAARLPAKHAAARRQRQMADEARARLAPARRDPPPPQDGLRHPGLGLVPRAARRRGARRSRSGSALAETGWFDAAAIRRLAEAHRSGRSDHGRLLWQLLMLEKSLQRLFGLGAVSARPDSSASTK